MMGIIDKINGCNSCCDKQDMSIATDLGEPFKWSALRCNSCGLVVSSPDSDKFKDLDELIARWNDVVSGGDVRSNWIPSFNEGGELVNKS